VLFRSLDDQFNGAATQVRVVQGKEPLHFLTLFKGTMIIHSGGTASGFKNKEDADSYDTDGINLFHIKGTNAQNVRAVQVTELASSLNSGDVFLLRTPEVLFAWFGNGANADERSSGLKVAELLKSKTASKSIAEVSEGQEPAEFWQALGGEQSYPSTRELAEAPRNPRLFQGSNSSGTFKLEEVFDFAQDDLDNDDVFLLDVFTELFVWLGRNSNETERKLALSLAEKYVLAANDGRASDVPISVVSSGSESPMFTAAFLGWDHDKAQEFEDPYEKKMRAIAAEKAKASEPKTVALKPTPNAPKAADTPQASPQASPRPVSPSPPAAGYLDPTANRFPLADLQAGAPPGVDPKNRELYLSDEDFKKAFKMDRATYKIQKEWKQEQLKKEAKLW